MNMLGSKIDVLKLLLKRINHSKSAANIMSVHFLIAGIFLFSSNGCVMTKTQGDQLTYRVQHIEDEVAKLSRVRHDLEILVVGQIKELIDRTAKLERQLASFRESLSQGSFKNTQLVAEIQSLRNELEFSEHRYRDLLKDQENLAKNQIALQAAQNRIAIPPLKEEHFALAKKYYLSGKFDEAVFLFNHFIRDYPNESDLVGQSQYLLGELYRKQAETEKSIKEKENFYKKSIVSYQKIIEMYKDSVLRQEALFKMGLVLKDMGNKEGALAAFKELLNRHKNSKRANEARKEVVNLEKKR
jgi:TolA-binding protein